MCGYRRKRRNQLHPKQTRERRHKNSPSKIDSFRRIYLFQKQLLRSQKLRKRIRRRPLQDRPNHLRSLRPHSKRRLQVIKKPLPNHAEVKLSRPRKALLSPQTQCLLNMWNIKLGCDIEMNEILRNRPFPRLWPPSQLLFRQPGTQRLRLLVSPRPLPFESRLDSSSSPRSLPEFLRALSVLCVDLSLPRNQGGLAPAPSGEKP